MISIITPTHDPQWIEETANSLKAQTYQGEWEWLVLPNNGAVLPDTIAGQARVIPVEGAGVGAIKRQACELARGDIIVELDHDDLLTPDALKHIADAFEEPGIDFVYSNFAEFHDGTWKPNVYDAAYGWQTRPFSINSHNLTEMLAFPPTAHAMSLVHYAPNHVRAWRADAYWRVGGHAPDLKIVDDHDLCCRFYLDGRMKHIDECLYLYRLHGDNSYLVHNAEIQAATCKIRDKYLYRLAERWADLEGLPKVDLGAAHGKPDGYIGLDLEDGPGVDQICDVTQGLPFDDNSVGVIRAFDFLEHIPDSVGLMNEIWRVLADGGWLLSGTPSTDGRGAFQAPDHVSFWNENSFWYYTNCNYAAYVPSIACRFQVVRVVTSFPTDFHRQHNIPYVYADLAAVKTWRRRPGLVEC